HRGPRLGYIGNCSIRNGAALLSVALLTGLAFPVLGGLPHSNAPDGPPSQSLVSITGLDKNKQPTPAGFGFFVSDPARQNIVATDYHLIKDAIQIRATLQSGESREARLLAVNHKRTFAILSVAGEPVKSLDLACTTDALATVGYALGSGGSAQVTMSALKDKSTRKPDPTRSSISPQQSEQNAGTPLLDDKDQVIGVVVKAGDGASSEMIAASTVELEHMIRRDCREGPLPEPAGNPSEEISAAL